MSLTMANKLFAYIFTALMCPLVFAESIQISDQFGNPIENVMVSITSAESISRDKLELAILDQIDKQFTPRLLVVQKNQIVSFPNSDDIRHHLYSFSMAIFIGVFSMHQNATNFMKNC
jgi:S-adenosylmethionine hydrolase